MITGLDHIAMAVVDLDAAVDGYTRLLGRTPNWIGSGAGVRHAWFQLPHMALDLMAAEGEGPFGDAVRARLASHGEGLWALAFSVADIEAAHKLIGRRGIGAGPIHTPVMTAANGATRAWTNVGLDSADTGGLDLLLVAPSAEPWPVSPPTESEAAAVAELDHVVVNTPRPDQAIAVYGAKLGLDLRLDRSNENWGVRQLFFRAGPSVVEMVTALKDVRDGPDSFGGLAWRVADADAARARIAAAGFDVSEVRTGRKPGTRVFTVRSGVPAAPALMISAEPGAGAD